MIERDLALQRAIWALPEVPGESTSLDARRVGPHRGRKAAVEGENLEGQETETPPLEPKERGKRARSKRWRDRAAPTSVSMVWSTSRCDRPSRVASKSRGENMENISTHRKTEGTSPGDQRGQRIRNGRSAEPERKNQGRGSRMRCLREGCNQDRTKAHEEKT